MSLNVDEIEKIEFSGNKIVGDLSMKMNHNFFLKNGLMVHNTETHTGVGAYSEMSVLEDIQQKNFRIN